MRFLMICIDMLRPGLLHIYDKKNNETSLDKTIKRLGGTAFLNCYTPAPDSPRSSACLWSGKYPKENGCDLRIKWPRYFLNHGEKGRTWLDELDALSYKFNFFISSRVNLTGLLPPGFEEKGYHSEQDTLDEFLDRLVSKERLPQDSMTYILLNDFHMIISDNRDDEKYIEKGIDYVNRLLECILEKLEKDLFDMIIIYSDHGFRTRREVRINPLDYILDKKRLQIFMFIHMKKQKVLSCNDKLCSIMDIYPTIIKTIGKTVPDELEGHPLFSEKEAPFVLCEDHTDFGTSLGQTIESWGVIEKERILAVGCDGVWETLSDNKNIDERYLDLLKRKMSFFEQNNKMYQILQIYQKKEMDKVHSDGQPRKVKKPPRNKRIKALIIKMGKFILRI